MCLITSEPDGYILRKDKTVYKEVVLTITRKGSVSMLTPYMDFPIKEFPTIMEASKKFRGKKYIDAYNDDDYRFYKGVNMYSIESEGVHAYLQTKDYDNNYGKYPICVQHGIIKINVRINCIIPKGTRIWKCYKPIYTYAMYSPDIAAEKMILKSIIVPEKADLLQCFVYSMPLVHSMPSDVEKILSSIEKINNGSLKLSKK